MNDEALFAIYFGNIVAMQYHPKNAVNFGRVYDDLPIFADIAEEMVRITRDRLLVSKEV